MTTNPTPVRSIASIGAHKPFELAAKALHQDWTPEKVHHLIDVTDAHIDTLMAATREEGYRKGVDDTLANAEPIINRTVKRAKKAEADLATEREKVIQHERIAVQLHSTIAELGTMLAAERAKAAAVPRQRLHEMQYDDGRIGWYFDCDGHYIDVDRDKDGNYSVFFKNRADLSEAFYDQAAPTAPAEKAEAQQRIVSLGTQMEQARQDAQGEVPLPEKDE